MRKTQEAIRLDTTDGEHLASAAVFPPLPDRYVWNNREFQRVQDSNIYVEVTKFTIRLRDADRGLLGLDLVEHPLPRTHVWHGREFRRDGDTDDYVELAVAAK